MIDTLAFSATQNITVKDALTKSALPGAENSVTLEDCQSNFELIAAKGRFVDIKTFRSNTVVGDVRPSGIRSTAMLK